MDAQSGPLPDEGDITAADVLSARLLGGTFLAVAVALLLTTPALDGSQATAGVALIVLYALAYRIEFVHPISATVPTEPVLVGLLLLVPLQVVPVAVMVAQFAGTPPTGATRRLLVHDSFVRLIACWHCVGPVMVLMIAGAGAPALHHWPLYLVALLAQFAVDIGTGVLRERALGGELRAIAGPMAWTMAVDALLAVIGLGLVVAADASFASVVLLAAVVALVGLLAHDRRRLGQHQRRLGSEAAHARTQARVDELTGLGNRRAWNEALRAADERRRADPAALVTIVLADLDNLKTVNDTYGHDAGDALLRQMGEVLRTTMPPEATSCRLGGDEFAVVHVDAGEVAIDLGDALRDAVRRAAVRDGAPLAASIGSATCEPFVPIGEAIHEADQGVYREKRAQRTGGDGDRVRAADWKHRRGWFPDDAEPDV